jgi:uncharacterized protein (UPF0264 family)
VLLLVSVTDADEARLAVAGGADIVDAKNPSAGALGAVSPAQLAGIAAAVRQRVPLSAAFGDVTNTEEIAAALGEIQIPLTLIKIGFRGAASDDLESLLGRALQQASALPGAPGIVAVAYADHDRVTAPSPEQVISAAIAARVAGVLVDTAVKEGSGLFGCLSSTRLREWAQRLNSRRMFLAIAGKLGADDLARAADTGASVVGVRGAACIGGRNGRVSAEQVRRLRIQLAVLTPERPDNSATTWLNRSTSSAARQRHHMPLASASEK